MNIGDAETATVALGVALGGVWGKWYCCEVVAEVEEWLSPVGGPVNVTVVFKAVSPVRQYNASVWERIANMLGYMPPKWPEPR